MILWMLGSQLLAGGEDDLQFHLGQIMLPHKQPFIFQRIAFKKV
jgi:hypothetical protein